MNIPRQIKICAATALFLVTGPLAALAQPMDRTSLQAAIRHIADTATAKAGVAATGLDFNGSINTASRLYYPMQSTYKFPLALAVLHQADKGTLSLKQIVHTPRKQLDMHTWSPMLKDFPGGDIDLTVEKLLVYAVSKSDNNACDILFRLAGGTRAVQQYIRSMGIRDINIAATEAQMKKSWAVQYTNRCRPDAMLQLLKLFYSGTLLTAANNALLMKWMTESENSPNRLKGLLPPTAVVAHKTGTSDTNEQGITGATNDIGIITLPDGRHYAVAVFVSDYEGGVGKGEHIIAAISKLIWDYFTQNKK